VSAASSPATTAVTLAWNPSSDPAITGYYLYEGVASHTYTNKINAGAAACVTLSNLVPNVTYYFAVTQYSANGMESPTSSELSYTVPLVATAVKLQMTVAPAKQVTLAGTGTPGAVYNVQASQNLSNWTTIGSATINASGSLLFTNAATLTNSRCFYRLQLTSTNYIAPVVAAATTLQMALSPSKQLTLASTGTPGATYNVQASQDLNTWTTIGSAAVNASGSLLFTNTSTLTNSRCFYRVTLRAFPWAGSQIESWWKLRGLRAGS